MLQYKIIFNGLQCCYPNLAFTLETKSSTNTGFFMMGDAFSFNEGTTAFKSSIGISNADIKEILTLSSSFLISLYNSNQFIFGIFISISAILYNPFLKDDSARSGSLKESTTNPLSSKTMLKHQVISGSSSTSRILNWDHFIVFLLLCNCFIHHHGC